MFQFERRGSLRHGKIYPSKSSSGTITDANGNVITTTGSVFTDTLNQTVLTISGAAPNPVTLTYSSQNGASQHYTVNYTPKTIRTAFNCNTAPNQVNEYSATNVPLITSIVLAGNNGEYDFTYEPTPGAQDGAVTGRIASVRLPSGGTISYTYSATNDGIVCSDGSTAGFTRTTIDGTTQYARSGSGSAWTTTITDGMTAHNQTTINFQSFGINFYETARNIYAGTAAGNPLRTIYTCYNGASPDCSSTAVSLPITRRTVTTKLDNNQQSKVDTFYDTYERPTEIDEYDFGSGAPGAVVRKKYIEYANLSNGIIDRVGSVTVQDGSGAQKAYTTYGYDETTPTATSGVPQHGPVTGSRGNLTSVNQWLNSPVSTLSTHVTYDDTGNILTVQDPGLHTTSFSYTDSFSDGINRNTLAFVTTTTGPVTHSPNAANHVTTAKYDVYNGLASDTYDQNSNHTSYTYDELARPLQISYPDGGKTKYTYSTSQIWTWKYLDGTNYTDSRQHVDGLGRIDRHAYLNAQGSWDMEDTCFDANGRVGFVSYAYQDAAGWGDPSVCTGSGDTYNYDALNRPTSIVHSDTSSLTYTYQGRAVQVQEESNGSYTAKRILQNDGLGRLAKVCEVSNTTQLGSGGTPAACNLDYSGNGFLTTYGYDTLDNLTHVDQGGYATRTYGYDSLSRMTSEAFPEQNGCTTSYGYDNNGNLISRVRPAPNQANNPANCNNTVTTTYSYDELNRLRSRSYSDGTTPEATFNYDEANTWSWPTTNPLGRLTSALVSIGGTTLAGDMFAGADAMGRILHNGECTPRTCGNGGYDLFYTYDQIGDVTSFNDASLYALTNTYNSAGRLTQVTSNYVDSGHPATIINNIAYNAFGVSSDALGNGVSETFGYSARGALNSYTASSIYSFSLGLAPNGSITSANDSVNGNWSYTYDDFDRLTSSTRTGVDMHYSYDRFGNRWDQTGSGGPTPQYSIDTNNHITDQGVVYDILGNVINDGQIPVHNFVWDAENRVSSVNGVSNTYDAFGRRVKGHTGEVLYDLNGNAVTWLDATNGNWNYSELYAGGRHIATYSGGTTNFLHTDWLGTKRATSSVSGANSETCTGLPFGDGNSCTGTNWSFDNFTDFPQDFESNTEHALFRQLSTTEGRWISPDPAGLAAVNPSNPQMWNRYTYVTNSPETLIDALGLDTCGVGTGGTCVDVNDKGLPGPQLIPIIGDCWSHPSCNFAMNGRPGPPGNANPGNNSIKTQTGHTVVPNNPLTAQQQQCVQSEINYADRTSKDRINSALKGIGTSTWHGMAVGAVTVGSAAFTTGEIFGGELSFGTTGIVAGIGGGAIGGMTGGIAGFDKGVANAFLTYVQNARLRFVPSFFSTYDTNLQNNIQKKCGVSVKVK